MDEYIIDYNEQMLNYYPEVIKAIRDFQVLIQTQSLQIKEMHEELAKVLNNAYVGTADADRISEWEQVLGITPLPQGDDDFETWLSDRRETILARVYRSEKLNSNTLSEIVKIFTGGSATSYFKDGTVHVVITPPPSNKQYKFANVEQEIGRKIPAHLKFEVRKEYSTWNEISDAFETWQDIYDNQPTWNDVLFFTPDE